MTRIAFDCELPEGVSFLCLRHLHDGTWQVSARDPLGLSVSTCTARSASIEEAFAEVGSKVLLHIADRHVREAEVATRLREARSAPQGALNPAPEGTGPARPRPSPAAPAAVAKRSLTRPASAVTGWTDSVPRQAAEWHVDGRSVRVVLWPGLQFPDGGSERTFATVRLAKDTTRAAVAAESVVEDDAASHVVVPDPTPPVDPRPGPGIAQGTRQLDLF